MKRPYIVALLTGLLLLTACSTPNKEVESLFVQADSLMDERPDSILHLLKALPATQKLSRRESARYALLLARATDKCVQPLLPCDSLLDLALDYYGKDERERAVALLYKGRLEVEMDQSKRAIGFFLQGLDIIEEFPEEIETKRHLLSSLGNEYYNAKLYEEAGKTYKELYEYCITNKDKAIALNGLSSYYDITHNLDSALSYQHEALKYAQATKDSDIIAISSHNLSLRYFTASQYDTALNYARMALCWVSSSKSKSSYYSYIGNLFLEKEKNDSAIFYINKSLEDSINYNLNTKAIDLLNLSYIKEEEKDYETTTELLYQFINLADSIYSTEQSTKIQQLVHQYDIKQKVDQEQRRSKYILKNVIGYFLIFCFVIIVFFQHRINKRDKQKIVNEQRLYQMKERYINLQHSIEESQRIITFLRKEQSAFSQEAEKYRYEIAERETTIEKLKTEKDNLRNWLFKQSSIYKKIAKLSEQKVSNKKELAVLPNNEQIKLKETIWDIYDDYIIEMKKQYPLLTDEDLLYLCIEKVGFSNQVISLCFGNTNTHAIAQRKYRIKERMNGNK